MIRKIFAYSPYWVPAILWMGVMFFFSSLPDAATPGRFLISDKILHGAEYLILAFLILFALQRTTSLNFAGCFWIALIIGTLWAISDEIHQLYVPTRNFDFKDMAADIGGILILFLILWILQKSGRRGRELYLLMSGKEKP